MAHAPPRRLFLRLSKTSDMTTDHANPFVGAHFLLSCARLDQLPQDDTPEVAFVGRSNAGKSSALNRLCGHNALARVSKTPGRTQLINLFVVTDGRLADLPGYGYAKVSHAQRQAWDRLIGGYMERRTNLRGLVLIMDVRHPLTPFDQQMLLWAVNRELECHVLLTKADKLGFGAAKSTLLGVRRAMPQSAGLTAQLFSAQDGMGQEAFRLRVQEMLTGAASDASSATEFARGAG